jgi:TonB family protein
VVTPDLTPVTRGNATARTSSSTATSPHAAPDNRSAEISSALEGLAGAVRTSGARATVVTVPGEGGGEAFVGYETAIYNAYYHAWMAPQDTSDNRSADAKIVVARDGTILSREVARPSGNPAIDRSVQRVLDQVRQLPPFPEGAQDAQRSFIISFSLEATHSSG